MNKKSDLEKLSRILKIILLSVIFVTGCSSSSDVAQTDGTSITPIAPPVSSPTASSSTILTGPFAGSSEIQFSAIVNYNTIKLSWTKPVSTNSPDQTQLVYKVYLSRSNNISTIEDAMANGKDMTNSGSSDISNIILPGLSNNIPYFFNVVVTDENNISAILTTVTATTLVGPAITDFTTVGGVPTVNGSNLNLIWNSKGWINFSYSMNNSADCLDPINGGGGNLNYFFGTLGQSATSWAPESNGVSTVGQNVGSSFPGRCMSICSDNNSQDGVVCSNSVMVTGD